MPSPASSNTRPLLPYRHLSTSSFSMAMCSPPRRHSNSTGALIRRAECRAHALQKSSLVPSMLPHGVTRPQLLIRWPRHAPVRAFRSSRLLSSGVLLRCAAAHHCKALNRPRLQAHAHDVLAHRTTQRCTTPARILNEGAWQGRVTLSYPPTRAPPARQGLTPLSSFAGDGAS